MNCLNRSFRRTSSDGGDVAASGEKGKNGVFIKSILDSGDTADIAAAKRSDDKEVFRGVFLLIPGLSRVEVSELYSCPWCCRAVLESLPPSPSMLL